MRRLAGVFLALLAPAAAAPLLVVSVDGLDHRYLEDADRLGLRIPHLRKLMREGQWARGVMGIVPTITWPSHTTILTGAEAAEHGILGNRRPASEGGDYYWDVSLLRRTTLLERVEKAGKRAAAITWPVTVNAPISFNLPEYFRRRRSGAMDTDAICEKARPAGLCASIAKRYPSFGSEWVDDRARTLAARYLLEVEKPDLTVAHLVDLDGEAHEMGPFTRSALATVEYTDELIGQMMSALPAGGRVVVVSDHGFERVDREVNLGVLQVPGLRPMGGVVVAETAAAAEWLAGAGQERKYGVGRRIPAEEVARLAPAWREAAAVYESAPGVWFGSGTGELESKPHEVGRHGHWPTRYRAVFLAWGPGIRPERTPELPMKQISEKLSTLLGLSSTMKEP